MRAKELLTEYRRDVTAQKMGDKLIQAFMRVERPSNLPDILYHPWTVVDMINRPERYDDRSIRVNLFGTATTINKEVAPHVLEAIKPKFVDIILGQLEQGDPTPHKEYAQWIASRYITGDTKLEDIGSTLQEYLYKFNVLKRKKMLKPPANDINRYPSFSNFMDNMDEYELPEDEVVNKGEATEVYRDAEVRIIVPEDQTAACYYGRGTRWCTAATRGTNYYGHYARQGPLYILIPTPAQYEGEKYQLHFPSEQFMDENDDPVSLNYVINDRFHVLDFFKQQEPEVNEYVEYVDDSVLAPLLAKIAEIARDWMWSELTDWETQDDYYTQWQAEQARRLGYVDDEGDVDWDKVHDDEDLNNYLEFNDDARSWEHEISTALDYSPRMVKAFAAEPRDGNDHETYKLDQLDALIARIVNYETGNRERDPNHIAAMIKDRIGVRKTGDQWEVFNSGWSTGRGR
jgi:hypothetical protein